ncbi:dTDP-D-glucose 4,6-dehydratase [Geodia barretti]|uniref:dTDP-D-glucose 4,6-dehydratase n=1 Tax=Geodia barretti TaxID=519541 RepID=A0AA35RLT9_GEOBA|nr:dTDP-D-glucose 4,6-dehydratase [Geodia barretti]
MVTLVTGGTGFVGSNIVRELALRGHEVVSLDIGPADSLNYQYLGDLASQVAFVTGNILEPADLESLRQSYQIEKIVHAAVFTVNRTDLETARSKDIVDINITGTANMLEMARLISPERFVYISSGSMYGMTRSPDQYFNEDDPSRADTLYGITKAASEAITQRYGELHGFPTVSLRLSTPYGPMERVTGHRDNMSVPHQWTGKLLRGDPIAIDNSGFGRDYTYVLDIASAIVTVVDSNDLPHDRYNITNGVWVTCDQIQRTLSELFPEVRLVDEGHDSGSAAAATPTRGPLSGYRLWHDFGWTPQFDLAAGLTHYVEWRRETGFLD